MIPITRGECLYGIQQIAPHLMNEFFYRAWRMAHGQDRWGRLIARGRVQLAIPKSLSHNESGGGQCPPCGGNESLTALAP
jgi:hypothetical protein